MDTRYCLHPVIIDESTIYPCGKCPVCRMKYRKQMALRMYMEKSIMKPAYSYFTTLTYDNENIPLVSGRQCFDKGHVVRFIDSLRHRLRTLGFTLRYFGTCEYGEEGYRPHYHFIFFISRESGRYKFKRFEFNDSICSELWRYGFTKSGSVTLPSIMYCTCYALKDDEYLERDWTGFEEGRPFRLFSNRPGLGCTDECLAWWTDYVQNDGDTRTAICIRGGLKRPVSSGIPLGVKRKISEYYPDVYEELKAANQRYFADSIPALFEQTRKYGSLRNYTNKNGVDPVNFAPDEEIKAFRKALRELSKRQNHPI